MADEQAVDAHGDPDKEAKSCEVLDGLLAFWEVVAAFLEPSDITPDITPFKELKKRTAASGEVEFIQKGPGFNGIYQQSAEGDTDVFNGIKLELKDAP